MLLAGPPGPSGGGGVSYIRWGRTTCNDSVGAELVYLGRAAGSPFNNAGGGGNYICLPDDPDFLQVTLGLDNRRNRVHGAEYHTQNPSPAFEDLHDFNVPCVACHIADRAEMIVIPARVSCPDSWTMEYYGYLMSGDADDRRVAYECLDIDAEGIPQTGDSTDGAIFAFNEISSCNGIDCPPYELTHEIPCVVCTY